jgi:glycosyltransferase involved in cell wall biosynthesis
VALEHLPLSADLALDPSIRHQVEGGERRALGASAHIVVTGAAGLALLAPYELDAARITVVEPGVDRATMATPWSSGPVELLAVGTVNHNKGYDVLLDALATIRHLNWRLTCAGSLERDSATAARVRALTTAHGLDTRVLWRGELNPDEVDACYRRAHVFVSTSRRETYGMAVAEALAHGLPVVATQAGAAASLVGADAGLVAPIDDPASVADVLDRLVSDATLRDRLVAGARRRRERLPSWEDAVARFSSMLGTLAPQASYD